METKKRTPKETVSIVEKTIVEIKKSKVINNEIIKAICKKYDIDEKHIRRVAGLPEIEVKVDSKIKTTNEELKYGR
jgi:hypothetical protein